MKLTGYLFLATLFCVLRHRLRCRRQDAWVPHASVCARGPKTHESNEKL
jgi:hypothetical protein